MIFSAQLFAKKIGRYGLLVSLLLHLLLLLSFSIVLHLQNAADEKTPELIQSYLYQDTNPVAAKQPVTPQIKNTKMAKATAEDGIEKPQPQQKSTPAEAVTNAAPPRTPSKEQLKAIKAAKNDTPVHLIGDQEGAVKPLVKLMGEALYAKLIYPRIAAEFNVRGVAYIGFTLYPDGHVTDVQVVQSSTADVLDQAAMKAVYAASPMRDVNKYLPAPKFLVVAFMFR